MSRQDRQGARTPADLEYRYAFGKSFAELTGIATDARGIAEEAKKVAVGATETSDGLSIHLKTMENELKAEMAMKVSTDAEGNLQSKIHIGADKLTIDTDNFSLTEDGTMEARWGKIAGLNIASNAVYYGNMEDVVNGGMILQKNLVAATTGQFKNGVLGGWTFDGDNLKTSHDDYDILLSKDGILLQPKTGDLSPKQCSWEALVDAANK